MRTAKELKNYLEERLSYVRKEEAKARKTGDDHMTEVWYCRGVELVSALEYLEK